MRLAAILLTVASSTAYAETPLIQTDFGTETHYIQKISDGEVLYCPVSPIGFSHCEYHKTELTSEGNETFGSRPNVYELSSDGFRVSNVITDFVREADSFQIIDVPVTAATYSGKWGGQVATSFSVRSLDDSANGKLSYSFKGKSSSPSIRQVGNVSIAKMGGGAKMYFLQNGDTAYGLFLTNDGNASHATLEAQPFEFENSAVCVQSYLNHMGFPVGRADGAIGRGSRAGGAAYLKANPSVGLEALSKQNTDEWCAHFEGSYELANSVVAVSGL